MKIYMIRHGETDWNVIKRLQGRSDIPLNEAGRELAKRTGEAMRDIPFTRVYTSPLKRARETAEYIKGKRDIPVIIDERLIEMNFGEYEGLCCGKDNYSIPDPDFMNFFLKPQAYTPPSKGESIPELCARTTSFLKELVSNPALQNETVLISTHGAAMMGLLSSINTPDIADFWHGGVPKNCSVAILHAERGKITLEEEGKVFATLSDE